MQQVCVIKNYLFPIVRESFTRCSRTCSTTSEATTVASSLAASSRTRPQTSPSISTITDQAPTLFTDVFLRCKLPFPTY